VKKRASGNVVVSFGWSSLSAMGVSSYSPVVPSSKRLESSLDSGAATILKRIVTTGSTLPCRSPSLTQTSSRWPSGNITRYTYSSLVWPPPGWLSSFLYWLPNWYTWMLVPLMEICSTFQGSFLRPSGTYESPSLCQSSLEARREYNTASRRRMWSSPHQSSEISGGPLLAMLALDPEGVVSAIVLPGNGGGAVGKWCCCE